MSRKKHMSFKVGDTVILRDHWLSNYGRNAVIIKDDGDGYFIVKVNEVYNHDPYANSDTLWCHCSMFM